MLFQNTDPQAFPGKAEFEQIHAELSFQWDAQNGVVRNCLEQLSFLLKWRVCSVHGYRLWGFVLPSMCSNATFDFHSPLSVIGNPVFPYPSA
jgi:hypothetical protein